MIIVGNGGLAHEVAAYAKDIGHNGITLVGKERDSWLQSMFPQYVVIAVGDPKLRKMLWELHRKHTFLVIKHPTAITSGDVFMGDGSIVAPGVVLTEGSILETNVVLNIGATVAHNSVIGAHTAINPGANIAGWVNVGEQVLIGSNATILERLTIGDGATIGAGAVVTKDVPAGETWIGVPARKIE